MIIQRSEINTRRKIRIYRIIISTIPSGNRRERGKQGRATKNTTPKEKNFCGTLNKKKRPAYGRVHQYNRRSLRQQRTQHRNFFMEWVEIFCCRGGVVNHDASQIMGWVRLALTLLTFCSSLPIIYRLSHRV